jgi:hypothetical protein
MTRFFKVQIFQIYLESKFINDVYMYKYLRYNMERVYFQNSLNLNFVYLVTLNFSNNILVIYM